MRGLCLYNSHHLNVNVFFKRPVRVLDNLDEDETPISQVLGCKIIASSRPPIKATPGERWTQSSAYVP
jgi:hypothetical protein